MRLRKENIYINLQGKSNDELTELYHLLKNNNERLFRDSLESFYNYTFDPYSFCFSERSLKWCTGEFRNKTKVTIQQLKEILQPTELSLTEQLEKVKEEVERLQKAIEDSKIKAGDWFVEKGNNRVVQATLSISKVYLNNKNYCKKITDQDLINKLNELLK